MRALLLVPECVRHHVLTNVVFVTVGKNSRAWTSSSVLEDRDGHKPRLIVLGPNVDEETVVHESFHVWHAPLPFAGVAAVSALGEVALYQSAVREGWHARVDEHEQQQERLARGAAIAWTWRDREYGT